MYRNAESTEMKMKIIKEICNLSYSIGQCELSEYEHFCKEFVIEKGTTNIVTTGEILNLFFTVPKYRMHYKNVKFFNDSVYSTFKYDLFNIDDCKSKINLSKTDIYLAVEDFYKNIKPYICDYYKELHKNIDKMIKYSKDKSSDLSKQYSSTLLNKNYIELGLEGTSEDVLTSLIHELAHSIACIINTKRADNNLFNFYEIESLFFETLSFDYFNKYFNDPYFKKLEMEKLCYYHLESNTILTLKKVYNEAYKKLNLTDDPLSLFNDLTCTNENYKTYVDIDNSMTYLYSYIVSISLLGRYKENKEEAISDLLSILNSECKEEEYETISQKFDKKMMIKYLKGLKNR